MNLEENLIKDIPDEFIHTDGVALEKKQKLEVLDKSSK